ncbi:MAG: putative toxin-antitoxin system toxin component, PIN family [Chloroflexota bacterium]|nr:putative toxin-antitoxin system toxin component, PIN family [Chloroflexota bacterium]
MRLVLDTNVLVAAIRSSSGASSDLIDALLLHKATLLLSIALFLEYQAVCLRPDHREASGTSEETIGRMLGSLVDIAIPVQIYFQWRPQLRDPKDEMVLEAAVNGRADAIVTFNQRDFGQAPAIFGVEVLRPGEVLRRIR